MNRQSARGYRPVGAMWCVAVLACVATALPLRRQATETQALAFDVVSIKPDDPNHAGGAWDPRPAHGVWAGRGVSVQSLLWTAYDLPSSRIEGLPEWANGGPGNQWVIEAKTNPSVTDDDFRAMLRAMLADRFHLVAHMETRDVPMRTLEVVKTGAKLHPASGNCVTGVPDPLPQGEHRCGKLYASHTFPQGRPASAADGIEMMNELQGWSITMADVCQYYGTNGSPIFDGTGIQGIFDIDLKFDVQMYPTEGGLSSGPDQAYKLPQALEQQLGLKINNSLVKRPLSVLIVDSVGRPTPN